jgi:2-amino-4-hydroxy-6-hydroxymethyldihydropteridine diphosphokinase
VKPVIALLLLGSNKGDRAHFLRFARTALASTSGCRLLKISRIYETAPIGAGTNAYLNQALKMSTTRSAMGLLLEAKRLEASAGRKPAGKWTDRPLDIDIIAYGQHRLRTPWLTVPHRLVESRAFALAPLAEIAPRYKLGKTQSIASCLAALNHIAGSVKLWAND